MKTNYIKTTVSILIFLICYNASAQHGRNIPRQQQTNNQPTEREIEKQKEKEEERRQEYIANFLSTLEADDFQKQIIKQTLDEFYIKSQDFLKQEFNRTLEQKDAFEAFKAKHFAELKELISESDAQKLDDLLNGNFKEEEIKKKRRKKRRRNKNKD